MKSRRSGRARLLDYLVYGGFALLVPIAVWAALGHFVVPEQLNLIALRFVIGQRGVDQGLLQRDVIPISYWLHIAPTIVWVVIGPLQFSNKLRAKGPALHRWSGRVFALLSVIMGLTGLAMAWLAPIQEVYTWTEASVVTFGVTVFLVTLERAIRAARSRRFADHREWMIRHVANGYIVITLRVLSPIWLNVTGRTFATDFVPLVVLSFFINVIVAEAWIQARRPRRAPVSARPRERAARRTPSVVDANT